MKCYGNTDLRFPFKKQEKVIFLLAYFLSSLSEFTKKIMQYPKSQLNLTVMYEIKLDIVLD